MKRNDAAVKEFQFLLGRLETLIIALNPDFRVLFQFLLGRLETEKSALFLR